MKKILNSGTLAVMFFGIGPFALLFWFLGVSGELILGLCLISGIIIKFTMNSKNEGALNTIEQKDSINRKDILSFNEKPEVNQKEYKEQPPLFQSKENYYAFWHSFIELSPELNQKRVFCSIINKYEVNVEIGDEILHRKYLLINLIKDRHLKRTDKFFINFSVMQSVQEKEKWHQHRVKRLLEKIESNVLDIDYNSIAIGDKISFDIKYNQPPILTHPSELGGNQYQLSWEELEKREYIGEVEEYEFLNFRIEKE